MIEKKRGGYAAKLFDRGVSTEYQNNNSTKHFAKDKYIYLE